MGEFFDVKFDIMGCITTTRKLENQCKNPHRAICSPAISLRVQPLQEIWSDFAYYTCITKMPLHSSFKYEWILDFENFAGSLDNGLS